jgi:glycosyltransferase involved in cell wall biosynthesis
MDPTVTYIIATYNRPDTLKVALQSLIRQTYPHWRAIVVGDKCDERTGICIARINDSRISYLNLTLRCGEQSGPNSVGMSFVQTPFLAFLNHDDLLLPDHVADGLELIRHNNAEFFIGEAARLEHAEIGPDNDVSLFFSSISPLSRDVTRTLRGAVWDFEPCSTWIVKTKKAQQIGLWSRSTTIHRTPLADWILRAWRARTTFTFGERITAVRVSSHYKKKDVTNSGVYAVQSTEHEYIDRLLSTLSCDDIRKRIDASFITEPSDESAITQELSSQSQPDLLGGRMFRTHQVARWLYYHWGIDLYRIQARLGGKNRKWDAKAISRLKTGNADFPDDIDYASLIEELRKGVYKS